MKPISTQLVNRRARIQNEIWPSASALSITAASTLRTITPLVLWIVSKPLLDSGNMISYDSWGAFYRVWDDTMSSLLWSRVKGVSIFLILNFHNSKILCKISEVFRKIWDGNSIDMQETDEITRMWSCNTLSLLGRWYWTETSLY